MINFAMYKKTRRRVFVIAAFFRVTYVYKKLLFEIVT